MKKSTILVILLILLCSKLEISNSQKKPLTNRFIINAIYSRSWKDDTTSFVEVTSSFYPGQILFQTDSTGYHGSVGLKIFLKKQTDTAYSRIGNYLIPIDVSDTTHKEYIGEVINKMTYMLGVGSYQMFVFGYDSRMPSHYDSLQFSFEIQKRPRAAVTSDLDLCSNIIESSDKKDKFYKNGYSVRTNPSLVFGMNRYPVVFSYIELYNLQKGAMYSMTMQVLGANGSIQKSVKRNRYVTFANTVDVATLNVHTFPSGKYYYQYILSDSSGNEIARTGERLFIYNPSVLPASGTVASTKAAEFAGLSDEELRTEFQAEKYIARPDQTSMFDKLTTTEARREFLAKFWFEIEGGQSGQADLTRSVYLARISMANERYHAMGKQGWQTDRGRVYLLYGEPDEIQRFPSSDNGKPYEIWNYHQIESGVIFVFIDRNGFGDYILVHSTKRGEIQDETWQRYLQ